MITAALLFALAAQDPQTPEGPQLPPPRPFNGIFVVVNEEAMTTASFYANAARQGLDTGATKEQRAQILQKSMVDSVKSMLMIQGGRDLGFDDALVERMVEDNLRDLVERVGSVAEFGADLAREQLEPQELRKIQKDNLYRDLWSRAINGQDQGAGGRVYQDRYVRPGRLMYEYRRQPARQIVPATVKLQELIVPVKGAGGGAQALQTAELARDAARRGEDFDALVEKYSASTSKGRRGILGEFAISDVASKSPDIAEFLATAQNGDISEPIPLRPNGDLDGFVVLRVIAISAEAEPKFDDRKVQELLRKRAISSLSEYRRELALRALLDAAYVWPPSIVEGAKKD